jgi:membrane peptidoglycan carboxypeptidase
MSNPLSRFTSVLGSWLGLGIVGLISGLLVTVMMTPVIAVTGITIKNTLSVFDALPDFIEIGRQAQKNEIYVQKTNDKDDGYIKIADVYWQDREEIPLSQMSQFLKDAAIDGEDRRFYEHQGVDLPGIIRAGLGNFIAGDITSGASTLTMQVIKNIYVQRAEALPTEEERLAAYAEATATSIERKLKEIKLAIGLEKRFSKEDILEKYLNISAFGGNTYGVEAAAKRYFGVSAADVTVAQAASLLAIVQYPVQRNLTNPENYAANQERRDFILGAMLESESISQAQYDEAVRTPVDENFVNLQTPSSGCIAGEKYTKFFCDYVVKNVTNFDALGTTKDERITNWYIGGYKLYTTLDYALQKTAQKLAWRVPKSSPLAKIGAVTNSVEVGTGRVLAMAQNKLFNDTLEGGGKDSTAVNLSTDKDYGGSSGFQTGSTYKIFALVAWLKSGRGLGELVNAGEFKKNQAKFLDTCEDGGGPWGGTWEFKNDSTAPKIVSVMNATKFSINSAFASIAEQLDQCDIRKTAESLGVHRADGTRVQSNPAAVLGTNELAPLTMANAWAGIANSGKFCESIILDHAVGPNGEDLPGQPITCSQAVEPDVAHATILAMKGVMNGGTGAASNPGDGVPIFGKTGTTDNSTQTWIVVSTSRVATATWVGNIVGKFPMRQFPSGAIYRHQITSALMRAADRMYSGEKDWPAPSSRLLQGNGIKIPAVQGLSVEEATTLLVGLGLEVKISQAQPSETVPIGFVTRTSPGEGEILADGMTVKIFTSSGPAGLTMPDFVTTPTLEADARATLTAFGVPTVTVTYSETCDVADTRMGYVISQYPVAGTVQPLSEYVRITILRLRSACPPSP